MFGKKKKKDTASVSNKKKMGQSDKKTVENTDTEKKKIKKKKKSPIKKVIIIFILLGTIVYAGFFAYQRYFLANANSNTKTYTSIKLRYITLPDTILKFTFDYFPDLYASFVTFNHEIILVDGEITRIQKIAAQYPLDKNIADKEKKIWQKTRDKVSKGFKKIESKTEAVYVLFQVNRQQGMEKIKEVKQDLESSAKEELRPVIKLTQRLKHKSNIIIPKGFIKGTIYRLRKKFGF